jgi:DNA polymerase-1
MKETPSRLLTAEDILACSGHLVVIDTETNGLHWWENDLIGIGIHCPTAGITGYVHTCTYEEIPFGKPRSKQEWLGKMDYSASKRGKRVMETVTHQPTVMAAVPSEPRIKHFLAAVHEIVKNPKTVLVGHNLKFDAHFLRLHLWELPCKVLDTSVMVHLYDSRLLINLASSEKEFLGSTSKRHHVRKAQKRFAKSVWLWDARTVEDYCVNDCVVTHQLGEVMMPLLEKRGLLKLLGLCMKYMRLLQKIEWRGMMVTTIFCHEAIREFDANLKSLEKDLFDTVGYEFNWRSSSQLSKAIYENLGIPKPTNPFSESERFDVQNFRAAKLYTESATSTPLLIKENHPLVSTIVDLRETAKLREYADKYIKLRDRQNVLHASFNQSKTLTGRLSSSEPNLQNLPSGKRKVDVESTYTGGAIRSGGYNLRQALVPRAGYTLLSIDHKQQEVRLLAILAQEPVMLEAMANREDIHLRIAKEVWGDCGDELNKLHRDWSKAITFGLVYGLSEESLQEYFGKLKIEADAVEVKQQYFETFPGLQPWFQQVIQEVRETGGVRYWSGRLWFADNPGEGYKGINALIQGGCADFMSVVLLRCNQILEKQGWGYIVSVIHDEVLFEIQDDYLEIAAAVLSRAMEGEDIFGLPFATDVEVGDSYGTLEDFPLMVNVSEIDWRDYV